MNSSRNDILRPQTPKAGCLYKVDHADLAGRMKQTSDCLSFCHQLSSVMNWEQGCRSPTAIFNQSRQFWNDCQNKECEYCAQNCRSFSAHSSSHSNCCREPDSGRGRQPLDIRLSIPFDNASRSQKSDPRDQALNYSLHIGIRDTRLLRNQHEQCGAQSHQHMRS
jgi:hypothetical protein